MIGYDIRYSINYFFVVQYRAHVWQFGVKKQDILIFSGKRFAQQDQIVFLSSILRKYRVEWASDRKLGQKYNIIMFPDIDPKFRFIPRN